MDFAPLNIGWDRSNDPLGFKRGPLVHAYPPIMYMIRQEHKFDKWYPVSRDGELGTYKTPTQFIRRRRTGYRPFRTGGCSLTC